MNAYRIIIADLACARFMQSVLPGSWSIRFSETFLAGTGVKKIPIIVVQPVTVVRKTAKYAYVVPRFLPNNPFMVVRQITSMSCLAYSADEITAFFKERFIDMKKSMTPEASGKMVDFLKISLLVDGVE